MTPANWDIKQADFVARFNLKIERKFKLIENFKFYDIKMMNDIKLIYQKHPSYFNVKDIIFKKYKILGEVSGQVGLGTTFTNHTVILSEQRSLIPANPSFHVNVHLI